MDEIGVRENLVWAGDDQIGVEQGCQKWLTTS
jgi:hypothetical protein